MFGVENVNFYGRFNFYYGVDFSPYYSYLNSGYYSYVYPNMNYYSSAYSVSNGIPGQTETTKMGLSLTPFIGAKYRISEHFSASVESSFYVSYFIAKTKINNIPYINTPNNTSTTIAEKNYSGFDFSMKYLRFLTLNYHL